MKNTMKTIGLTAVVALTLTACGGGGGGSDTPDYTPHPYDAPPISAADKNAYLNAVNNARATGRTCGSLGFFPAVPPLSWSDALYKAAYEHSEDMATSKVFEHIGSGTNSDWTAQVQELGIPSNPEDRGINNGAISSNDALGENIAKGSTNLGAIINAWLKSDGHCLTIMEEQHKTMGMARVGSYWTLDLLYK